MFFKHYPMNIGKSSSLFFALCLLALVAILPSKTYACHLAAADMYIDYIGKGVDPCAPNPVPDYTYRVTLVTYSSCNCGLTTGLNETLYYSSANGATGNLSIKFVPEKNKPDTIDQLCPNISKINQCRVPGNSQYPGYKRMRYSVDITLPSGQSDWRFWWSSSARNPSTNLTTTGSLYIEVGMDVLTQYYNNTPRFSSNPLPYICAGQKATYLNLPNDPDKDDITITSTVPKNSATGNVTYAGGYSSNNPIGPGSGFTLNSKTGTAEFTPSLVGLYTLSFNATDGKSYVIRDVQIAVLKCSTPPPKIDSLPQNIVNATLQDVDKIGKMIYACPGSNIKFDINCWTDTITNQVYMRADNATSLPSPSNFSTKNEGTQRVTGTLEWTPTVNDYGDYNVLFSGFDSTCTPWQPVVLYAYAIVPIRIVAGLDAGPDLPICELNPIDVQLFVKGTDNLTVQWSVAGGGPPIGIKNPDIPNPKIHYPYVVKPGDTVYNPVETAYIASTPDLVGACKSRDTVVVYLDTANGVVITPRNPIDSASALVVCRPGYVQLEAHPKGRPPLNNAPCGINNPTNCSDPDTTVVYGSASYGSVVLDTADLKTPVMPTHLKTAKKQFLITKKDLWDWGVRSATIKALGFETVGNTAPNHEFANFTIWMKCTNKTELKAEDGFETTGMVQVYYSPTITLADGWHDYKLDQQYTWDTTKNLIVQICYHDNPAVTPCGSTDEPPVIKYSSTSYVASLGMRGASSTTLSVCGVDKSNEIVSAYNRPVFRFTYCETHPLPFEVLWNAGNYLSDSTIYQPLAYVPESGSYVAQVIGRSGCKMRDTLDIYVPKHDFKITPEDTSVCFGEASPISVYGGHYYKWYEYVNGDYVESDVFSCKDCAQPVVKTSKSSTYRVVVSDSVYCYDTLEAHIEIMPLPDVRILNEDATLKYGRSMELLATGARTYDWRPVSSLSNPFSSHPMATPTENTRYILAGIGANGCRAFDTLYVTMDYRDKLFVPSAFSPNGDGKNDVFRLSNRTFQRVMEFRVFNRWGQEIFSTTDNDRGWDGTWRGEPQPVGSYTYLIRVGYPDGFVETYKGDFTLVR